MGHNVFFVACIYVINYALPAVWYCKSLMNRLKMHFLQTTHPNDKPPSLRKSFPTRFSKRKCTFLSKKYAQKYAHIIDVSIDKSKKVQ